MVLLAGWAVDAVVHLVWIYLDKRGIDNIWLYVVHMLLWHVGNHIMFFVVVLSLKFILIRMEGMDRTIEEVQSQIWRQKVLNYSNIAIFTIIMCFSRLNDSSFPY